MYYSPFATRRRREASFSPRYRSTCMCKAFRQRSIWSQDQTLLFNLVLSLELLLLGV